MRIRLPTLALKPRGNVTRSEKHKNKRKKKKPWVELTSLAWCGIGGSLCQVWASMAIHRSGVSLINCQSKNTVCIYWLNSWDVLVLLLFVKLQWAPDFVEFVLGSFSCFYIEIAYSNVTFCDAYSFLAHRTISGKRAHRWGLFSLDIRENTSTY